MAIDSVIAFHPGQMVQTAGVFDACTQHPSLHFFVRRSLARHLQGDWGDCCEEDADSNDVALQGGGRLFSVYEIPPVIYPFSPKLWIITESDRSATTVLFPHEY